MYYYIKILIFTICCSGVSDKLTCFLLIILILKMNRHRAAWLENYKEIDNLTPWDTDPDQLSIDFAQRHRKLVSLSNHRRYTSSLETQTNRIPPTQSQPKYPLKSLPNNQNPLNRYSTLSRDPKSSQPMTRSGWLLRQLKIKNFMMCGK